MGTVHRLLLLSILPACGYDLSQLIEGPRGVRFATYDDAFVYETSVWLATDAVLRVYDTPPFDQLIIVSGRRSDYRDGLIEVDGADTCERNLSLAHNMAHVVRELMEGNADTAHHDARFFGADTSVEYAPRNTFCLPTQYIPKE